MSNFEHPRILAHLPPDLSPEMLYFGVAATETRLLRISGVINLVGLCRASIYNLIRSDSFPKPIKLGSASLWIEAEVRAWIVNKVEEQRRVA